MSKLLYIFDARDWHSRIPVAEHARERGIDVKIGLINPKQKYISDFEITALRQSGQNLNPLSTLMLIRDMHRLVSVQKPDIIHVVTLKYSFMAGIAALPFPHMRKIFTLAGLGYLFRGNSLGARALKTLFSPMLKYLFHRKNTVLIFQNQDDQIVMINAGFVRAQNTVLIKGSGIDIAKFDTSEEEDTRNNHAPLVLMPTRLIHEKGIAVFIESARILKGRGTNAIFQIAGGITKDNPGAITHDQMQAMTADKTVEWLGRVEDMPALLAVATLIVYPSYYGEGIPRVLLEACAAGRAIITTDHPGCREAIDHGKGGLLVPIKDAQETANAIQTLLDQPDLRVKMEICNRTRAEREFNIDIIAEQTVRLYLK